MDGNEDYEVEGTRDLFVNIGPERDVPRELDKCIY